jgi:hypothetical protein
MVSWLHVDFGLDQLDAYQLVSQAVESPLANVVDVNYTSVAKMAKRWLPRREVFTGTHAKLRALATEYGRRRGQPFASRSPA